MNKSNLRVATYNVEWLFDGTTSQGPRDSPEVGQLALACLLACLAGLLAACSHCLSVLSCSVWRRKAQMGCDSTRLLRCARVIGFCDVHSSIYMLCVGCCCVVCACASSSLSLRLCAQEAQRHLVEIAKITADINADIVAIQEVQNCVMLQRLCDGENRCNVWTVCC